MNWLDMTPAERNRTIKTAAHGFCAERFKLDNPCCTDDEAWAHAERHWREFVPLVIDWIALCTAAAEAEQAAPWN